MYGASDISVQPNGSRQQGKAPALKAIVPTITASDYYEGWTYQGGAFQQGFIQFWTAGMAAETITRLTDGPPATCARKLYGAIFEMPGGVS